jgi:hypothetical protein
MRWFGKSEHKEIWDEEIQWPLGDIEAADKIRNICRSAGDSAERIGGFPGRVDGKNKADSKQSQRDTERYERAAKAAMEIAMKISDDLMRDSAVGEIVDLCARANDVTTARILFRAIQAQSIREDVLNQHPVLRE